MKLHADVGMAEQPDHAAPTSGAPGPSAPPEASAANVRLVRLVSLLLLLQVIILLGITLWFARGIDWEVEAERLIVSAAAIDVIALGIWFSLSGIVLLPTAIALYLLRRSAWIIAMAVQVLLLTVTLTTYFFSVAPTLERSYRMFMVMASCVVLVFYLNLSGVRTVVEWRDEHLEAHAGDHGTD